MYGNPPEVEAGVKAKLTFREISSNEQETDEKIFDLFVAESIVTRNVVDGRPAKQKKQNTYFNGLEILFSARPSQSCVTWPVWTCWTTAATRYDSSPTRDRRVRRRW